MAHKMSSFTFKDQQDRGPGYWKLNVRVLNDKAYIAMVRGMLFGPTARLSDSPLVRQPIGPTAHWSDKQ